MVFENALWQERSVMFEGGNKYLLQIQPIIANATEPLIALLLGSLFIWRRTLGSVSVSTVSSPKAEMFYWVTIMFYQTLGTALGDWTTGTAGLGCGYFIWSAEDRVQSCGRRGWLSAISLLQAFAYGGRTKEKSQLEKAGLKCDVTY